MDSVKDLLEIQIAFMVAFNGKRKQVKHPPKTGISRDLR